MHLTQLDNFFQSQIKNEFINGASIFIEHKQNEIFRKAYGTDNLNCIYQIIDECDAMIIAYRTGYEIGRASCRERV